MKCLKKVSTIQADPITGSIVDTFNVQDKTTNAPSVHAVEDKLSGITSSISTLSSNAIQKGNIKVLTGSVTLDANSSGNVTNKALTYTDKNISFPSGFNKDNCIVIAFASTTNESSRGLNYGQGGAYDTVNTLIGSVPRDAILKSDGITLKFGNFSTSTLSINYKLYLMKIS